MSVVLNNFMNSLLVLHFIIFAGLQGLTENDGHENDGPSKLQGMKLQDMKMTDMKLQDMKLQACRS